MVLSLALLSYLVLRMPSTSPLLLKAIPKKRMPKITTLTSQTNKNKRTTALMMSKMLLTVRRSLFRPPPHTKNSGLQSRPHPLALAPTADEPVALVEDVTDVSEEGKDMNELDELLALQAKLKLCVVTLRTNNIPGRGWSPLFAARVLPWMPMDVDFYCASIYRSAQCSANDCPQKPHSGTAQGAWWSSKESQLQEEI